MSYQDGGRDSKSSKQEGKKSLRNKYRSDFNGDQTFDYKDPVNLTRFISDGGKITPARLSKLSVSLQKKVAAAVKKARNLGLVPVGTDA